MLQNRPNHVRVQPSTYLYISRAVSIIFVHFQSKFYASFAMQTQWDGMTHTWSVGIRRMRMSCARWRLVRFRMRRPSRAEAGIRGIRWTGKKTGWCGDDVYLDLLCSVWLGITARWFLASERERRQRERGGDRAHIWNYVVIVVIYLVIKEPHNDNNKDTRACDACAGSRWTQNITTKPEAYLGRCFVAFPFRVTDRHTRELKLQPEPARAAGNVSSSSLNGARHPNSQIIVIINAHHL